MVNTTEAASSTGLRPNISQLGPATIDDNAAAPTVTLTTASCQATDRANSTLSFSSDPEIIPVSYPKRNPPMAANNVSVPINSFPDSVRKTANDNYNQHLKAKALRDTYNANIEKAEKEWKGRGQKDRDWILGCLESRAQLSPFISHAYLDMERKTKYALEALRLQFQFATLQPNLVHQLTGEYPWWQRAQPAL
ncbi:hypothetical protein EMCRGX_G011227 [Ephydatia muelleri]